MGAFAHAFPDFAARRIPLIPTRADKPSKPMVARPDRIGIRSLSKLSEDPRFANANAGIWTGPRSRLTIVDIDSADPAIHAEAIRQFGDTPLKAITPSGGGHNYYLHACEGRRVRPLGKSFPVDILGNGLVVAPPSVRPTSSEKVGGVYRFVEGSLADLDRLPVIKPGSIPDNRKGPAEGIARELGAMKAGDGRNDSLFRFALKVAKGCSTAADHLAAVLAANNNFPQPLSLAEAQNVAASAWQYKERGTLIVPGERAGVLRLDDFARCKDYPFAIVLLAYLRAHHRPEHQIVIVPEGIAPKLGVTHNTVRKAREYLLAAGYLKLLQRGGILGGDKVPNLYRLA